MQRVQYATTVNDIANRVIDAGFDTISSHIHLI